MRTAGGHRMYNIEKFMRENTNITEDKEISEMEENTKLNICYIRVSTVGQKDDLKRQKEYMEEKYPNHMIIEDIGSGINFNRRGLRKIIKYAISGNINELVVAYKDRLTRFGYDLIEDLIKEYSNGKIIIDEKNKKERREPKEDLVEDVLQILNVYTAKLNGLRKYKKNEK
jgi:predicted site-specific integrase-resolvase